VTRERLEELLAEFVERREAGESLTPERFASEHPEAGAELARALGSVARAEALLPSTPQDLPPVIAGYRVVGELGRGGMGRVLKVLPREAGGPPLALKLLAPAALVSERAVARFRREGEALRRLQHPGIVSVIETGFLGDSPFLVMECLEGESLAQALARARARAGAEGRRPRVADLELPGEGSAPVRSARVVAAVARAVAAAHGEGLLHRDLKPSNVLLTARGPVLIDFGLAGDEAGATLTTSGEILGTPHYMAPEQARGGRADARTDVHGLGAVLFELLTLEPPHPGSESLQVLDSVRRRPLPPIRTLDRSIPPPLEWIVRRATAFRKERRPGSAAELADALEAFVAGAAPLVGPPALAHRLDDLVLRRRGLFQAAAVVVLLGAVGLWAARGREPDPRLRALEERAAMALAEQDWPGATQAGQELLVLAPDDPIARFLAGKPVEEADRGLSGSLSEGRRRLEERDAAGAALAFGRAVAAAPRSIVAVVLLGVAARRAGALDQAERELTVAVRQLPGSAALRLELARVFAERDRWPEALEAYTAGIDRGARHAGAWGGLARACFELRRFQPGLEASTKALEAAGEGASSTLLRVHATLLDKNGRSEEAQALFRSILARDSAKLQDRYNLVFSLDSAHRLFEARDEYRSILEEHPGENRARVALAWLVTGSKEEECAECRAFFEKHPEVRDVDEGERLCLAALREDRGQAPEILPTVTRIAQRTGRKEALVRLLEELSRDPQLGDQALLRVSRALRALRR